MSTGTPTDTIVAAPTDTASGSGGERSGLEDLMPFFPEQLVLIDHLIPARVATTTDSIDGATTTATSGGPATMTSTTGEYLLSLGPNWDWAPGCLACWLSIGRQEAALSRLFFMVG